MTHSRCAKIRFSIGSRALWIVVVLASLQGIETARAASSASNARSVYLTWQHDPTTTMTVQWLDRDADGGDTVRYCATDAEVWRSVVGSHHSFPSTDRIVHLVELTNLKPATDYTFQIGEADETYRFRTMPADGNATIRFVEGGDMMRKAEWMEQTCRAAASHDPMFGVTGGDLAYANNLPEKAERWFDYIDIWSRTMIDSQGRLIPVVPVIGNHEMTHGEWDKTPAEADMYYAAFAMPENRSYRALDFGSYLSLILLDTDHSAQMDGEQLTWLSAALAERREVAHVFPVYHVPAWPSHRSIDDGRSVRVRKFFVPVFERFDIDIAFENHDHTYKRTYRIRHDKIDPTGVLYVGDGAWGVDPRSVKTGSKAETWYLDRAESTRNFILIELNGKNRQLTMFDSDNRQIDQYP